LLLRHQGADFNGSSPLTDTVLYLLDGASLDVVDSNDDGGKSPYNSQLAFSCAPGEVNRGSIVSSLLFR